MVNEQLNFLSSILNKKKANNRPAYQGKLYMRCGEQNSDQWPFILKTYTDRDVGL